MKLTFVNRDAVKKASKTGALVLAAGILACTLSGCDREVSTNAGFQYHK